jgi:transposase
VRKVLARYPHIRRLVMVADRGLLSVDNLADLSTISLPDVQADLEPAQIVQRYKSLAYIERGFRVLKSEIEIAPVYHRLPERISAHASICFMALILYRVMRQRLKAAGHSASPESALAQLRKIQRQSVAINQRVPLSGISNIHREQADLFAAMNIRKPVPDAQLSLLSWKL